MATLYADGVGAILTFLATELDEQMHPETPPGTTYTVAFDEEANSAVVQAITEHFAEHDCAGGVLHRNGQAVTIAPPSAEYTDLQQLQTYWNNLAAYLALNNPTNAQSVAAIKTIIRVLRLFYRALRRSGQMTGLSK
jgi:hypothetical protein